MFSIFKRKSGVFPVESKWVLYQGQNDGKPLFVRRNDSAKQLMVNSNYDTIIGIAVPFFNPTDEGFAKEEELSIFGHIEDELFAQFEKDMAAIVVLIITTGGMREFISYAQTPMLIEERINEIKQKFPEYDFQVYIEEDKKWNLYQQFK